MIAIKYLFLIVLSFILAFLDISLFSFIGIYGATLLTSFLSVIIFSLSDKSHKDYLIVALSMVLFFSVLSSLPLLAIILGFFVIPASISYIREKHLPEPSAPVSILYFFVASVFFEIILIVSLRAWDQNSMLTFAWFVFLHALFGFISFSFFLRIRKNLTISEIKL